MPLDPIQVGPGAEALPPKGHARTETLKARKDRLDMIADQMVNNTEVPVYSVDPAKLREEPEILRHLNFVNNQFEVSNPVPGKVYFWCRDERNAIAQKRAEVRMWLGANHPGWEIVGNGDGEFPECSDLKSVDGRRMIGDVCLMRIDLDTYELMQKRIAIVQAYRANSLNETLEDFQRKLGSKVSVIQGAEDPRALYRRAMPQGGPLVHTDSIS